MAESFRQRAQRTVYRTSRWKRLRRRLIEQANYRCQVCGRFRHLEVHHAIPLRDGGRLGRV